MKQWMGTTLAAMAALAMAAGCGEGAGPIGPGTDADATYYEDIRPILNDNCVSCHTDGGIAPFALTTYMEVAEVADRVRTATRDRLMPPYLADASGDCQTFHEPRWLAQAEIDLIDEWVRGGLPEGDPNTAAPTPVELPTLPRVDLELDMGTEYTPEPGVEDDYRCFLVEPTFEGFKYVTGYDVRPGNERIVHHVIVYNPITPDEGQAARLLDQREEGPGYTCYGDARVVALPTVIWAPGAGAINFPENTGIRIDDDRPLIIQMHYNATTPDPAPDRSIVDLVVEDEIETPANMGLLANFNIELPPRMPEVVQTADDRMIFAPVRNDVLLWGAFPHMHTLGRQLRVNINDAENTCLVDVPAWDFNWQGAFFYEQPVTLSAGDTMRLRCSYDTMSRDEFTYWGDGTQDEMCLSFFYVTTP